MSSRILTIEDNLVTLGMFQTLLQAEGYDVISSPVACEMAEVEATHPNLIILDIRLQGQADGFTFLQKLKLNQPTKDIPVIICTADVLYAREQEENLKDKGIPIIYKPFDIDVLFQTIHQILTSSNP
jgi:CheY-like chemotaxis protein